jgi:polyhydroxyalkanoate synthesis regulator phasin
MAKNADQEGTATSRAEQLRAAVESAFSATTHGAAPVQKRAQDLADELATVAARLRGALGPDELAGAAGRVRDALEDLRPPSPEELGALRAQVAALEARVAELEAAAAKPKPAPARRAKPRPKPKPPA